MHPLHVVFMAVVVQLCFQKGISVSKEKRSIASTGIRIPFSIKKITSQKMSDNLLVFSVTYEADVPHSPVWFLHKHLPVFGPVDYDETGRGPYWTRTTREGRSFNTSFFTRLSFGILFNRDVALVLPYEEISISLHMNPENLKTKTYLEQNIQSLNYLPPLMNDLGDKVAFKNQLFEIQSDIIPSQSYAFMMVYTVESLGTNVNSQMRFVRSFEAKKSDKKLVTIEASRVFNSVLSPMRSIKINAEVGLQFVSPINTFAFDEEHTKVEEFQTAQGPCRLTRCAIVGSYDLKIKAEPELGSYFRTVTVSRSHMKEIFALERNFTRIINFSCVAYDGATEITKVMNSV